MFVHKHPYPPFIPRGATHLIVGTLPPPRFSFGNLIKGDVDFNYGSRYNLLWPILERIYNYRFSYQTDETAVRQRKRFLAENGIGICDIVQQCERQTMSAADSDMKNIVLRDLFIEIDKNKKINTLLFMGGGGQNSPEKLFRKLLNDYNLTGDALRETRDGFGFDLNGRTIRAVRLVSPSGSANRSIGAAKEYKILKKTNPEYNTLEYRVAQYKNYLP